MENASSPSPPPQKPTTLLAVPKALATASSKIKHAIVDFGIKAKNIGVDDPRRIVHSLKVALSITLVSMVYYLQPLYNGMGDAGMWAVLTVVVVFEYTVGATLSKGMNRGLATLLAGALGIGAESFASLFGPMVKPFILGCLVFFLVGPATFSRFIPSIKKRYDYGVLIFILTFSLVSVSGYRVEKIIELAHKRLSTILFGGATCIIISICVCPVWAGEDLHQLIVENLEKLANFLEGFGGVYFRISEGDKPSLASYKSVLNSKATEESLVRIILYALSFPRGANFAWWEVGHGKFRFRHPWKQYLKIGASIRQCAYHIESLNGYLDRKTEVTSEFQKTVEEPCMKMSSEVAKALKELGLSMKVMMHPSSSASAIHMESCRKAKEELNTILQVAMVGEHNILETIPVIAATSILVIAATSILVDIINCVETISEAIEELAKQAHFKKSKNTISDKKEKPNFLHDGGVLEHADGGKNKESVAIDVDNLNRG